MTIPEKEWFIEAPWGKICIIAWGDCWDPPVLLCHGVADSAACFRPLVQKLPRNFYYIAMEFPGNGRSDAFPPGLMISCYDLVYPITVVAQHFRWERFVLMAHSLGTTIGLLYHLSYPGKVSKLIELDPVTQTVPAESYRKWYQNQFTKYYEKFNSFDTSNKTGPQYTWEEALATVMKNRDLSEEAAAATLERMTEPAGNGLIRFTFDQRMKLVTRPPFAPEGIEKIFTSIPTPTLAILAEDSVANGRYDRAPFKLNEGVYPHGNYRVRTVAGGHDVHFVYPERVAGYVSQFLLHGLEGLDSKAKL